MDAATSRSGSGSKDGTPRSPLAEELDTAEGLIVEGRLQVAYGHLKRLRRLAYEQRDLDVLARISTIANAARDFGRLHRRRFDQLAFDAQQDVRELRSFASGAPAQPIAVRATPAAPRPITAAPVEAAEVDYAPRGAWFAAWIVDVFIVVVLFSVVVSVAAALSDGAAASFMFLLACLAVPSYFALSHASERGQTLGKRTTGVAVRNERDLGRLGYGRAFAREFVRLALWVFVVPAIIDGLSPLWDRKHQTWHDKVAHSIVVRRRPGRDGSKIEPYGAAGRAL